MHSRLRRALPLLLVFAAACGDSTGPKPSIEVAVEVRSKLGPYIGTDEAGATQVRCEVWLRATAEGGGRADWSHATWYWYAGRDRAEPLDSARIPAATVRESWGKSGMAASDTLEAGWEFWAGIPFGLAIEYHYRPEGAAESKTTRVAFECGPEVPPDAEPPAITSLVVAPTTEIEASGTLAVTYAAHSDLGLWRTDVDLSGPCELHREFTAENLQKDVSRTMNLELPGSCRLGEPITVRVSAVDAAMVVAARTEATGTVIVDNTPPRIGPWFFVPSMTSMGATDLEGDLFVGDSVRVDWHAWDNYRLDALVWEALPYGHQETVTLDAQAAGEPTWIRIRPEWVGSELHLRLQARDHGGRTSAVVTTTPGAVTVRPTIDRPTWSAQVQGEIRDFVIDDAHGVVHLLQSNQQRLTTLSLATLAVASSRGIPPAVGLDITPGGDSVVLALHPGALGIADPLRPDAPISTIPISGLDAALAQRVGAVRVASNRKAFISTLGNGVEAVELVEVDLTTGSQRVRDELGHEVSTIVRSLDHTRLVGLGTVGRIYDPATDTFGAPGPAERYGMLSLDATGRRMADGLAIYDESLRFLRRAYDVYQGGRPIVAMSADGEYLYQAHWKLGVLRSRTSDGALLDRTPNAPGIMPTAMRVSPSGAYLVVVESLDGLSSRISVIDLR